MASARTTASTAPAYTDEFSDSSSSSEFSRKMSTNKLPYPYPGDNGQEMTEERMMVLLQEQFERKKQLTLTTMNRAFVKSINAYALVLVLLATVTYAGFLQPPGAVDADGFMRTYESRSLTWFVYFNSLSFYFSMADLLLCLSGNFAPLADLHTETFLHPSAAPKEKPRKGNSLQFLNDFVERITTLAPEAPCPSLETLAKNKIPDSVYLEQAITHRLAHFVAYTLTKAATINLLFVISLTCCVAAFAAAGSGVMRADSQLSVIVSSAIGCFIYLCFMIWLLADSMKFFWRAGFSLGAVASSLADTLAENAGHLEVQLQYCGGNVDPTTADKAPETGVPILDSRTTFARRVGTRDRTPPLNNV